MTKHEINFFATKIREDGAILEKDIWLVTCKKCKHYEPGTNGHGQCRIHFMSKWDADDFCSRGEKKCD